MPLTVTGSLADPTVFGQAVVQYGRRAVATNLRRQGNQAGLLAQNYTSELGPSRSGNRRRDKGVSYRNGFDAPLYTGLDDFASGIMQITMRNRSRHARVLEVGAKAHDIPVGAKGLLAWPIPYNVPGPAVVFAHRTVKHRGFDGHHILERASRDAMQQGFVGQQIGHAQVVVRVLH